MKTKLMRRTMAVMLSASLITGLCISLPAAENDLEGAAGSTEVSEKEENGQDSLGEGVPGDFPGEPPEGGQMGTPPEMPDGNGGPGGTPPDGTPPDGNGGPSGPGGAPGGSSTEIDYAGAVEISSNDTQEGQSYTSNSSDENALLISTSQEVTITDPTVTKTGDSCLCPRISSK